MDEDSRRLWQEKRLMGLELDESQLESLLERQCCGLILRMDKRRTEILEVRTSKSRED